jgi:hypothetical protein
MGSRLNNVGAAKRKRQVTLPVLTALRNGGNADDSGELYDAENKFGNFSSTILMFCPIAPGFSQRYGVGDHVLVNGR